MLKLYTYFRSSASYRVRIALNLKGLAYEAIPVHLTQAGGQQHAAAFTALNPSALVPVLVDGDLTLSQSLPIIEYLNEIRPEPPLLPADAAGRARVRAIAQGIACEIHPLNNLRVMRYLESQLDIGADARQTWYRHWVMQGFDALERSLQTDPRTGRYCHGDTPTLADCCLVPQVFNAERFGVAMEAYPTIRRIADQSAGLDAFALAAPAAQADAE